MDDSGSVKTILINENKTLFIMNPITSFVKAKNTQKDRNASLERGDV